jgi:heme/copper-type cytochrome/quinol oxidase subunit 1
LGVVAVNVRPSVPTWRDGAGIRVLSSVDHKHIGIFYLTLGLGVLAVAGMAGLLLAFDLDHAPFGLLDGFAHNQVALLQSTGALYGVALPIGLGLACYLAPLQIGARRIALPQLNAVGLWTVVGGVLLLITSPAAGNAEQINAELVETFGGPLSSQGRQFFALGMLLVAIGSSLTAVSVLATIARLRAPAMVAARMPVFAWAASFFSLAVIVAGIAMGTVSAVFLIDAGTAEFFAFDVTSVEGGHLAFYGHLPQVWFFGHPLLYAVLILVAGAISEIVRAFSSGRANGRGLIMLGLIGLTVLSILVSLYHLVADGFSASFDQSVPLAAFVAMVPMGVCAVGWLLTLKSGRVNMQPPFALALLASALLIAGTIIGLVLGFVGDFKDPSSYHLTALFSGVLGGATIAALLGALHYWFPKITGRALDPRAAWLQVGLLSAGLVALLIGQYIVGESNIARGAASEATAAWSSGGKIGAAFTLAGFLLAFFALAGFVAESIKAVKSGRRVGSDPWSADTLEWFTTSPPPATNFNRLPEIRSSRPLADLRARLARPHAR